MRFHVGDLEAGAQPPAEGWRPISSPNSQPIYLLAGLAGLLLLCALSVCVVLVSVPGMGSAAGRTSADAPTPWSVVILVLLLYIPAHEVLHLVWHPQGGRSTKSVVAVWPAKLRLGVYYEGCMARRRWLMMRSAPFLFLSVLPAALLVLFHWLPAPPALRTSLEVLMLVNTIGSGGDVVAVALVLYQVPRSAEIFFCGGRAHWRPLPGGRP